MKISKKKLEQGLRAESIRLMSEKIKSISSSADANRFLDLFFTEIENDVILRRIAVMILLSKSEKYRDIQEKLEISKFTISNIQDILSGRGYGKNPNRKRPPSEKVLIKKIKSKKFRLKYKGVESIV